MSTTETKSTKSAAPKKEAAKMVKIRLPKVEGVKGDLAVGWGGKMYKVKRGVTVEVPEVVAKIIGFSEAAQDSADAYEDSVVHD